MPETVSENKIQINQSVLRLIEGDISDIEIDAFVFYAQHDLALGSGFGTAISLRGGPDIQKELDMLGPLETGQAVVSGGGKLKANAVIHAVGPRFNEEDLEGKLRTTVTNTLKAADEKAIRRIAMPPMGAGFYMIPLDMCARVMVEEIQRYLTGETKIEEVVLCVMDEREFKPFASRFASLN